MKTFYANMIAFGMMTGVCFTGLSALLLFVPFLGAFITWDLAPLSFGWATTFLWVRAIFALSSLIGIMFVCSKEGQGLVKDMMND